MIPRLCYITDLARGTGGRELSEVIEAAARGGVGLVLLRERERSDDEIGRLLARVVPLRERGVRIVISRRLDLARSWGLDGTHLSADAVPVATARAWLGRDALIGYSAHSAEEALRVEREGASYVTLSPIYLTSSKPGVRGRGCEWLRDATRRLRIPALALGGVTPERAPELRAAGAWGLAAVSAIGAQPDVELAARRFRDALGEDET